MEISKTEIGNALTSADENHILATANDIYDETQQAYQSEINQSLAEGKQDKLVSGENIKTINGKSLVGEGDIEISGGGSGNFNESGTYPNLTAGKATKLATARKIGITGGATGTATNFDGSTAINIPVTSLDEGKLTWSKEAILNGTSTFDAIFRDTLGNKLSFLNPDAINIEYSRDNGVTWVDYGVSDGIKKLLVTPACGTVELYLGKEYSITSNVASNQLRITIDAITGNVFFIPRKILVSSSLAVSADISINCVKIEYALYGSPDVWKTHFDGSVYGQPGWNSYPGIDNAFGYATTSYIRYIRLTFYRTGTPRYLMAVTNIAFISNNMGNRYGNNLTAYGHIYAMDVNQNATFPANVTAPKHITQGGTNQQVVLGDGSLKDISELSPITDADADILLDNHIHNINVNANGNNVNISVIESSKNGNAWETTEKSLPIPVATQDAAGVISAADKKKIDSINYKDNTIFVGDGMNGELSIGYESSKASADMRVQRDRYATIHVTSYNDTTGGSIAVMESLGGKGTVEVNGDLLAELDLSGAGQVRATLTKKNEDGTKIETIIDAAEGITAPKLATIGGTSEQILLGDGTLITFDELKAKLGLI